MRCRACDSILDDNEVIVKDSKTLTHVDLCRECFGIFRNEQTEEEKDEKIQIDSVLRYHND